MLCTEIRLLFEMGRFRQWCATDEVSKVSASPLGFRRKGKNAANIYTNSNSRQYQRGKTPLKTTRYLHERYWHENVSLPLTTYRCLPHSRKTSLVFTYLTLKVDTGCWRTTASKGATTQSYSQHPLQQALPVSRKGYSTNAGT